MSMTKIAESGSISQRHGSADPDPPQNVMDPQHSLLHHPQEETSDLSISLLSCRINVSNLLLIGVESLDQQFELRIIFAKTPLVHIFSTRWWKYTSVADPDPGSVAFLTPGSGIRNRFFSGSRIPNPYFWELSDKKFYNSLKIGPNFFLQHFKTKIIISFVKFLAT